jgi:hypothetical protein
MDRKVIYMLQIEDVARHEHNKVANVAVAISFFVLAIGWQLLEALPNHTALTLLTLFLIMIRSAVLLTAALVLMDYLMRDKTFPRLVLGFQWLGVRIRLMFVKVKTRKVTA